MAAAGCSTEGCPRGPAPASTKKDSVSLQSRPAAVTIHTHSDLTHVYLCHAGLLSNCCPYGRFPGRTPPEGGDEGPTAHSAAGSPCSTLGTSFLPWAAPPCAQLCTLAPSLPRRRLSPPPSSLSTNQARSGAGTTCLLGVCLLCPLSSLGHRGCGEEPGSGSGDRLASTRPTSEVPENIDGFR